MTNVPVDLLHALGKNSADDSLRRIVADLLLEQGDSRGEFISLMMAARKSSLRATGRKRLKKMFARDRTAWLGPLAAVCIVDFNVDQFDESVIEQSSHRQIEIWDRGFPSRIGCTLTGTTAEAVEWLSVREICAFAPVVEGTLPQELESSTTANVKTISPLAWYLRSQLEPGKAREYSRSAHAHAAEWPERLRSYLVTIGRESLFQAPSEWPDHPSAVFDRQK